MVLFLKENRYRVEGFSHRKRPWVDILFGFIVTLKPLKAPPSQEKEPSLFFYLEVLSNGF
jgi:hypothetical protein